MAQMLGDVPCPKVGLQVPDMLGCIPPSLTDKKLEPDQKKYRPN